PTGSADARPGSTAASTEGGEADGIEELIFGGEFEEGDLIAWDQFVGQCNVDPECPTQLRFFSRCVGDFCEECVDSNDCLNNPTALGPTCVAGFCRCASDPDCAANPAGPLCHPVAQVCSCVSEAACGPNTGCNATPYLGGLTTCWGLAPPPLLGARPALD
ncbi:MAG: hypothetical protein ACRD0X_07660, partial [Thermoanaerobaculia bacterium]